jgi:ERCC4-type nuclease
LNSNEISSQHTLSKLVLLTIHFPRLRILWCSSTRETAEIFEELKAGYPQPSAEEAMSFRTDQIQNDEDLKYNPILWEMLLKVPGINSKNIKCIFDKVQDLSELCQMSEAELHDALENAKNAKLVYNFLNENNKSERDLADIKEFDFQDIDDFNQASNNSNDNDNNDDQIKDRKSILKKTVKSAAQLEIGKRSKRRKT